MGDALFKKNSIYTSRGYSKPISTQEALDKWPRGADFA